MINSADAAANAAANSVRWRGDSAADLAELAQARTEAINLVQWLARIANSYVREDAPQRRTDLEFRAADAAFVTKRFGNGISLEMRLPGLELQFLENGNPAPHIFDPEEHSPAEVEAWILVELLHRGFDREKFSKKLPYTVLNLMTGDENDHSPGSCRQGLAQLTALFQDAAAVLDAAARAADAGKTRILCLPQTLDLAWLSDRTAKVGDFGFSPGDAQNPAPYFYANAGVISGTAGTAKRSVLKASELLMENDPAAAAMRLLKLAVV